MKLVLDMFITVKSDGKYSFGVRSTRSNLSLNSDKLNITRSSAPVVTKTFPGVLWTSGNRRTVRAKRSVLGPMSRISIIGQ